MVKISIIIPVYNTEKDIERCIKSVIAQDFQDYEIIICDDASQDSSLKIIEEYKKKDRRIKLITHEKNRGLSVSRNDGIDAAVGEYIIFLDSDDYIEEGMLATVYNRIKNVRADILYFGYREYEGDTQETIKYNSHETIYPRTETGQEFFRRAINSGNICVTSWSAIYRRKFLIENDIIFKPNLIHEDNLFYYEVLMKADSVTSIEDYCYDYIRRNNSLTLSQKNLQNKIWSLCAIIHRILSLNNKNNNKESKYCTNEYVATLTRQLINYYKSIQYFDWNNVPFSEDEEMILKLVTTGFFNGFFMYKLPHSIIEEIKKYNSVSIYGAGKVGKGLKELLREYDINVKYFVQTNLTGDDRKNILGVPLKCISEIVEDKGSILLVATKNSSEEMSDTARKFGCVNVVDLSKYIR